MVDRHRVARDLTLALAAQGEQHVEGDIEQQQPAGDAEGGNRNPERLQNRSAAKREGGENCKGDDAGAQRDLAPGGAAHAERQADENRRQTGWIERHQEGDKGRFQVIDRHRRLPLHPRSFRPAAPRQDPCGARGSLGATEFDNILKCPRNILPRGYGARRRNRLDRKLRDLR